MAKEDTGHDADKRNEEDNLNPNPPWTHRKPDQAQNDDGKIWGAFLFALIGATATAAALSRSKASWKSASSGSFRTSFQEEAWKKYNRRLQEEYEEELERVERIRRMQSVFNRERNKYKRSYESWAQNGDGAYHHHFQRNDWYWKGDTSYRDWGTNFRESSRVTGNYPLSHHYSVLGLDRSRTKPYTDNEIKSAFRAKALEFHPDQNQNNKEVAEAKFREVMTAYEAIKTERKKEKEL